MHQISVSVYHQELSVSEADDGLLVQDLMKKST